MASIFIWMDSTLQDLLNGTKNTKFGVRTRKLLPRQPMVATVEIHDRNHNTSWSQPQPSSTATVFCIMQCSRDHRTSKMNQSDKHLHVVALELHVEALKEKGNNNIDLSRHPLNL